MYELYPNFLEHHDSELKNKISNIIQYINAVSNVTNWHEIRKYVTNKTAT